MIYDDYLKNKPFKIKEIVCIKDEHVDENWDILVGKIRACLVFLFV